MEEKAKEEKPKTTAYTVKTGAKVWVDNKKLEAGDSVELTEEQYEQLKDLVSSGKEEKDAEKKGETTTQTTVHRTTTTRT